MDAVGLTKAIKRAALDAVDASKPVQVCFGKVTSTSPLKILVEQKLPLGEGQLVLCRNVTEYTVEMTVDHYTENETKQSTPTPFKILTQAGVLQAQQNTFTLIEEEKNSPFIMGWLSVMKLSF